MICGFGGYGSDFASFYFQNFIFKISFIEKRKKDAGGHPFGKYKNINGADFIHAFSLQEGGAKRKSHFAAQSCKKKRRIGDFAACRRRPALHGVG